LGLTVEIDGPEFGIVEVEGCLVELWMLFGRFKVHAL